jgi:Ca2+-binding EF-hand superfamily protein
LREVLAGTAVNDDKIWDELISEADTNNDGQICFEEFKQMMMNYANINILKNKPVDECRM